MVMRWQMMLCEAREGSRTSEARKLQEEACARSLVRLTYVHMTDGSNDWSLVPTCVCVACSSFLPRGH